MSRTIPPFSVRRIDLSALTSHVACEHCDLDAVVQVTTPSALILDGTTGFYLCRAHLAELRQDIDKIHDRLKEEARSMLDHPVDYTNKTKPGADSGARYLTRRANQRRKRNSVAGQSETIRAARQKLSAEITADAIDELAFAWAQAVYARGGV